MERHRGEKIGVGLARELHLGLRRGRQEGRQQRSCASGRRGRRVRPAPQRRRPAERGASTVASVFIPDGRDRLDQGPLAAGARSTTPAAARSRATSPSSCSSTRAPPRPRRSSPARCRTASGPRSSARARTARASSRRSSAWPTAARWTSRSASTSRRRAATSAAAACARAPASHRTSQAADDPKTQPDEALQKALRDGGTRVSVAPLVGVLEKHGQPSRGRAVLRAREPHQRRQAAPRRARRRPRAQIAPGRGGRARIVRRIGRPDVARDVLEALMVAPRAAAAVRPAGRARGPQAAEAVGAGPSGATCATSSSTRRSTARTSKGLRRRDQSIQDLGDGQVEVGVHIADVAHYVRAGDRRSTTRRAGARDERLRRRPGRPDAARGALEPPLLPRRAAANASRTP